VSADAIVAASVVVRTIGRPRELRDCLASLAACTPRAAEIVVVDQSEGDAIAALVAEHAETGARLVRSERRGRAIAANVGLRAAGQPIVLFTDDDCTVAPDWVGEAAGRIEAEPGLMVAGRIVPGGDPRAVPTHKDVATPRDYTGDPSRCDVCASNMACRRDAALALGGFDESIAPTMEDWDLGFRWVRGGRALRYVPEAVVVHHDWREPAEVERVWFEYGLGCARFYAKLIRRRDPLVLVFVGRDVRYALRAAITGLLWGPRWWDPRPGVLRGVVAGLRREAGAALRRAPSGRGSR
jgi:GT2 family glycosyltransferase